MSVDREETLRRFEGWLDSVLAREEPPQGIAAELLSALTAEAGASADGQCDLYSMWAAVTALTQEVKLQGRTFKQLSDTLAPVADLALQLPQAQRKAQEQARGEMLDVLLDLRDRLARGLEAARASQAKMRESQLSTWTARLLARHESFRYASEALAALEEGYQISLDRLDDVLVQFDVREIPSLGQAFDPRSMHVVDVEETTEAMDGTVVEVYRVGYEWQGAVHRPAQVKVARSPAKISPGDCEDE